LSRTATTSVVGELVRFDVGNDGSVVGVVVTDMVDNFVVVFKAEFAVGAGVRVGVGHGLSVLVGFGWMRSRREAGWPGAAFSHTAD
jgi:hypothetical protein